MTAETEKSIRFLQAYVFGLGVLYDFLEDRPGLELLLFNTEQGGKALRDIRMKMVEFAERNPAEE